MKKIILALLCFVINISAQKLPEVFELGGNSLRKIQDENPGGNSIEEIVVVGDTIWLATGEGLSRSIDNGDSWTNYYGSEEFGTEQVSTLLYKNGIIYAATWHSEEVAGSPSPTGSGYRYSSDGGETWTIVEQHLDTEADTLISYGSNIIKTEAQIRRGENFIRSFGITNNTIWIASFAAGLRKSSDSGLTWEKVLLPPDNLDSIKPTDTLDFFAGPKRGSKGQLNYIVTAILVINDSTLYVGTAGGINKTTDGGKSWVKFNSTNQTNPISGNAIWRIRYNESDNSIWAATNNQEGATEFKAVSRTNNGGESWETFLPGAQTFDIAFLLRTGGSDIVVATANGVYRSSNFGASWTAAPEIFDNVTKVKIASNNFRAVAVNQKENVDEIWIGSVENGTARLTQTDELSWDGIWKVYLASEGLENSNTAKAFPNPFAPSQEKIKIQFSTNNMDAEVSIRIFDFGMNLVKTLLQNAPRTSAFDEYFEFWDGRNENGKVVPNGVYFYRIDIGGNDPLFGKIMVLN